MQAAQWSHKSLCAILKYCKKNGTYRTLLNLAIVVTCVIMSTNKATFKYYILSICIEMCEKIEKIFLFCYVHDHHHACLIDRTAKTTFNFRLFPCKVGIFFDKNTHLTILE